MTIPKGSNFLHFSHELRTPLYSIMGLLEEFKAEKNLTLEQLIKVDMMLARSNELKTAFNSIFNYNNEETGEVPIMTSKKFRPDDYSVLITEDDAINSFIMNEQIKSAGYNTYTASNANELYKIIQDKSFKINLILLDIELPDSSGFEICQKLREKYSKEDLPIIFISANSRKDYIARGFKCGGNLYIVKPVRKAELLAYIQTELIKNN